MNTKLTMQVLVIISIPILVYQFFAPKERTYSSLDMDSIEKQIIKTQIAYDKEETEDHSLVDNCDASVLTQTWIDKIIIHHTVSTNPNGEVLYQAISRSHKQRWDKWYTLYGIDKHMTKEQYDNKIKWNNWWYMMYHRLITKSWKMFWDRDFSQVWRWTKYNCNNIRTYHIALEWNFQNERPTDMQYEILNQVISIIRTKNPNVVIVWHWQNDGEQTSCPWKNFDYNKIKKPDPIISTWSITMATSKNTWMLSRYYSCTKTQTKRLPFEITNKQTDYKSCMYRQFRWDNDPLTAASWPISDNDAWSYAACPPWYMWKKFKVVWRPNVFVCKDTWSAIKWKRIDIYAWVWDSAIDRFYTLPAWQQDIYFL